MLSETEVLYVSLFSLNLSHSMTKPTSCHVRPAKTQISLGIPQSDQNLCCPHEETFGLKLPLRAQRGLGSDWAKAQADLSLRWAHRSFCWFCHAAAHVSTPWLMLLCDVLILNCQTRIRISHCYHTWASSWYYGTYHIDDQRRLRRACASAQSRQSLRCSHTWTMEVDEGSDQKSDI